MVFLNLCSNKMLWHRCPRSHLATRANWASNLQ